MKVIHIIIAMKPPEGNYATNAINNKVAGLNIDQSRVGGDIEEMQGRSGKSTENKIYGKGMGSSIGKTWEPSNAGRWPANLIHDNSTEIKENFPDSNGGAYPSKGAGFGYSGGERKQNGKRTEMNDKGSAARFFKACKE